MRLPKWTLSLAYSLLVLVNIKLAESKTARQRFATNPDLYFVGFPTEINAGGRYNIQWETTKSDTSTLNLSLVVLSNKDSNLFADLAFPTGIGRSNLRNYS